MEAGQPERSTRANPSGELKMHNPPMIEIRKDGRTFLRKQILSVVLTQSDEFVFNGWPVEVTVVLPSGHTETWIENAPESEMWHD